MRNNLWKKITDNKETAQSINRTIITTELINTLET